MDKKFKDFYSKNQKDLVDVIDDSGCLENLINELAGMKEGKRMLTRDDIKNIQVKNLNV